MEPSRSISSVSSSTSISLSDPARRLDDIEPFRVMEILARARELQAQGRDIIHLEVGEPDFSTPEPIIEAGIAALRAGLTHYTPALGLPELRRAIAAYYLDRYGLKVSAERIAVTPGASGALLLAMATLFNPGDEVLMADPGYPCNRQFARLIEARGVGIPVGPDTGFQLSAKAVVKAWGERTRGVLVANPGNPTGTVISAAELKAIHEVVRERGGWLLVDEIYHELIYDHPQPSAAGLGRDVIVINSFSKYFLMTGWRLGWMIAPIELMPGLDKIAQNIFLSATTSSQYAALAALKPETRKLLDVRKGELKQRRDFLLPELERLGFQLPVQPEGAFYVYAGIDGLARDGAIFCRGLLEQVGVAVTPGSDFGRNKSANHVRFAYTTAMGRIRQAVDRISEFLDQGLAN